MKFALGWLRKPENLGWTLLGAALVVYVITRLYAIADYPIYFFTDEAVQTVLAADFVRDHLLNYAHEFLPTYFLNVYQYNLSISVYLQVLPEMIFGKSVEVTRGAAALASVLAPLSVGLALSRSFGSRRPWIGVLVLSITPAWFLHSRTAFETSLAVAFYAAFLYCYLRYRNGGLPASPGPSLASQRGENYAGSGLSPSPNPSLPGRGERKGWWLYGAVGMAGLCFYSYSPAQMVVGVTAALLLVTDLRYHLRQPRRVLLLAAGLGVLAALPYVRFVLAHPNENLSHLELIGSYWVAPISLLEKLGDYAGQYLAGLNPLYWFLPNTIDLARHTMGGLGHLLIFSLPFYAAGLAQAVRRRRQPAYRVLLIATLAAPGGAALVGLGITRALFMVVPAALLTALGLEAALEWLLRRRPQAAAQAGLALFLLLGGSNFLLLAQALTQGPTWSTSYGLGGMQYGARQVFGAVLGYHADHPQARIIVSPTWTNGTDVVARFFLPDDPVVAELAGINSFIGEQQAFDESTLFILPPEEYQRALESGKFADIQIERILPWPDGRAGFYFLHLRYVDDIAAVFKREAEERKLMLPGEVTVGGEQLGVHYSALDMGAIGNIFDGDLDTLIRTKAANPLKLQLDYPAPHTLHGLALQIGGAATLLDVTVQVPGEPAVRTFHLEAPEQPEPHQLDVNFGEALQVSSLFISVKNTYDPEPGHVHLWEIRWK